MLPTESGICLFLGLFCFCFYCYELIRKNREGLKYPECPHVIKYNFLIVPREARRALNLHSMKQTSRVKYNVCSKMKRNGGGMGRKVGGTFKREVTSVYLWLIHVDVLQKPSQYCQVITLQLKIKFKKVSSTP